LVCACKEEISLIGWEEHIEECEDYQEILNKNIKKTVVKEVKE
jgi:hypothetical protein